MSKIIIAQAVPEDAKALIAFMKQTGGETDYLSYGPEGIAVSAEEEAEFIEVIRRNPNSVLYCAWKDNTLIGTGSLTGLPRRMSHRAELSLSVRKAEWNRGVGSLLMRQLIDYAKAHGTEIINLEVSKGNAAAIHLYEKFGFRKTGDIPAYFKIGTTYSDFVIMSLDLRQAISTCREVESPGADRKYQSAASKKCGNREHITADFHYDSDVPNSREK